MRRRPAGWIVLAQRLLEIAALKAIVGATARLKPRGRKADTTTRQAVPSFITEIADKDARRYRLQTPSGALFAGFYSDGRVRLAAPDGGRYSGVVVDKKVVMAALRDDVSFEMEMLGAVPNLSARISGGPYDGQTLHCEAID
ncbi:MAG: hypothetical protein JO193_03275 [Candidatus Eremiobacteraeota bacterium]|nr:hypothetical protein [Candidatus Eremiobacteraeota bacterium]